MSEAHKRKCWNCGNIAVHMKSIVPEVLCTKCGSQDTRRIKGNAPKPFIQVTTVVMKVQHDIRGAIRSESAFQSLVVIYVSEEANETT